MAVYLGTDMVVHFEMADQRVKRVELHVGGRVLTGDMRSCTLPRSIRVEGMQLLRDDLLQDEHRRDNFSLLFNVGLDHEQQYGQFARVQLSWNNGVFVTALITNQTGPDSSFSVPLCNPDVEPPYVPLPLVPGQRLPPPIA
jgi:hypothetical protein